MADEDLILVEDGLVVVAETPRPQIVEVSGDTVNVVDGDPDLVLLDDDDVLVVTAPGPQGPQGPPGLPGGTWYVHTQTTPSSAWVINHNLGRLAHTTVFVPDFVEVEADVTQNTVNQTAVTFATPQSGTAFIA